MRHAPTHLSVFLFTAACLLGYCDPATADPEVATQPKPGFARGRVVGADGKPIALKDVEYHIQVTGVSDTSGQNVGYDPKPNAEGFYETPLTSGTFGVKAFIFVNRGEQQFRFDLDPVQPEGAQKASTGVVRDFVWRLSGVRPGHTKDPKVWTNWYGASLSVHFDGTPPAPKGTKFTFTLTPTGKLVDGSEAKPITFERGFDTLYGEVDNDNLPDVPLGSYKLSGKETLPNGTTHVLLFQVVANRDSKYEESTDIGFAPYPNDGAPMGQRAQFKPK